MPRLTLKRGDQEPAFEVQLRKNGAVVDTAGWTNLKLRLCAAGSPGVGLLEVDLQALAPSTDGWVRYQWQSGDTDRPEGVYWLVVRGTNPQGRQESFPNDDSFLELVITPQIAAPPAP